ncbi:MULTISPECIES: ABC transporter ATP-binding protein [Paenochrobactrum]|uniref:ABC transporter ATP-binding protein n=1 Tax=Paenochrobactrum pullorum TaxID=1324351 RepID=UPI0035BBF17A
MSASPYESMPKLVIENARKSFRQTNGGEFSAIADLSFSVQSGEYVAIVGPTGAGKSVLLDCLLGLKNLDSGQIRIDGQRVENFVRKKKGHIARIFQEDRLLPWLSATDNAALALRIQGVEQQKRRDIAAKWLDAVGLSQFKNALPSELSGGMRQRVNIARAFAANPELVLLDEAFSALDDVTASRLRQDFKTLAHEQSTTFLIVTHSIDEAIFLANRILVFGAPARLMAEIPVPTDAHKDRFISDRIKEEVRSFITAGARTN